MSNPDDFDPTLNDDDHINGVPIDEQLEHEANARDPEHENYDKDYDDCMSLQELRDDMPDHADQHNAAYQQMLDGRDPDGCWGDD